MCYDHLYKEFADLKFDSQQKDLEENRSVKEEQKKMYNTGVLIICIHIYVLFSTCLLPFHHPSNISWYKYL